ncbi:reverse transcriptase, partial [Hamiltosporidium tvaerminnensis]
MGRRKKVDSENIKNEKIKAVNNLENSAGVILMCDVDVAMLSERLPPPPTLHDTTHQPPSSSCQTINGMKNFNTDAILEENLLMVLHSILDSVTVQCKRGLRECPEMADHQLWDIDAFKKFAQNEAEREIRQEENEEQRRIATLHKPERQIFSKIKEISEKEIGTVVVRTRKLPSELVDSKVLNIINRIIGEYADSYVPMTITAVAQIIEAAQKARKQENLSTSETKSLKKIMREFNLNLSSVTDLSEVLQLRNENRMFELFRDRFYLELSERLKSEHVVSRDEIVSFGSTMCNKNDDMVTYNDYLIPFVSDNHPTTFPSLDEFVNIINCLPNGKLLELMKLTTLHKYLYDIVKVICLEGTPQADWFYCGLTYLIPKGSPQRGSDYRPITCMSNLYKLTTKCVTKVVQLEVERRGLLAESQLGAVRGVQGAKEQALLNIALNKEYGNNLKATWIDVKKAYDSIDHAYLTQCIENLNLPDWILKFIKVIISKWKIDISVG